MSSIEDNVENNTQSQITKQLITLISVPIIDIDFKAVEEHYKEWKKYKKEEKLNAIKNKKGNNKNKPTKNNKKLDEDGNVKVVQLSKYQIFVKEIQPYINENYPGIAKEERMRKVGEEWKKHKETNTDIEDKPNEKVVEKKEDKSKKVEEKVVEKKEDKSKKVEEKVVEKKEDKSKKVEEKVVNKKEDDEITEEDDEITEEKVVEKKEAKKKIKK